jgi:hypothetical protein
MLTERETRDSSMLTERERLETAACSLRERLETAAVRHWTGGRGLWIKCCVTAHRYGVRSIVRRTLYRAPRRGANGRRRRSRAPRPGKEAVAVTFPALRKQWPCTFAEWNKEPVTRESVTDPRRHACAHKEHCLRRPRRRGPEAEKRMV